MVAYLVIFGVVLLIMAAALITAVSSISDLKIRIVKAEGRIKTAESNQKKITDLLKIVYKRLKEKNITSLN